MNHLLEYYREKLGISPEEHQKNLSELEAKNPIPQLEKDNAFLLLENERKDLKFAQMEEENASLFIELVMKGVI